MNEPNNYSGVTINITSPTVNASTSNCQRAPQPCIEVKQPDSNSSYGMLMPNAPYYYNNSESLKPVENGNSNLPVLNNNYATTNQQNSMQQVYPVQYYTNNYNTTPQSQPLQQAQLPSQVQNSVPVQDYVAKPDMSISDEIINNLDNRMLEEINDKKNKQEKKVVILTDEYIKSLENYLDNQNDEIRVMASKEVLKRLNEDRNRYDDAALNALLNKMLQDPNKLVRIAAMSALSSDLASGNDYTIELLEKIQANQDADKEDVLEASNILLRMSSSKKTIYVPKEVVQQQEQKVEENA